MIRLALAMMLALVLLAAPVVADEEQAEALFHQAYVQEVVQGHVDVAATTYLQLARDEKVPARIRNEARFRFAVCAALLGRADEARVWLGGLIQDPNLSDAARERAKSYLESLSSVGIGSELDKRLQDLVFELARAHPVGDVPVYRDFEILGNRARPLLKQLLAHEDGALRQHAFRLLCRMGEPGMGEAWNDSIGWGGSRFHIDVGGYFAPDARKEEVAALERGLLALEDHRLASVLRLMRSHPKVPFSLDFLREVAKRKPAQGEVFKLLWLTPVAEERWAQVQRWLDGKDRELALDAARSVQQWDRLPGRFATSVFASILRLALETEAKVLFNRTLVRSQPTSVVIDALAAVVDAAEAWAGDVGKHPIARGLTAVLGSDLADRAPQGEDLLKLEAVYRRWAAAEVAWTAAYRNAHPKRQVDLQPALYRVLPQLLRDLPTARTLAFLDWLLSETSEGRLHYRAVVDAIPLEKAAHVALLLNAARSADASTAGRAAGRLRDLVRTGLNAEASGALVRALPEIVATLEPRDAQSILNGTLRLAVALERDEVVRHVGSVLTAFGAWVPSHQEQGIRQLALQREGNQVRRAPDFVAEVVVPSANDVWEGLEEATRTALVTEVARLLGEIARGRLASSDGGAALAAFLRDHLDRLDAPLWGVLADMPRFFPLETWVPRAPLQALPATRKLPQADRDAAARALAAGEDGLTRSTLSFVRSWTSPSVSQEIFDALLRSKSSGAYALAIDSINVSDGAPASPEAVEAALETLLAADPVDEDRLRRVARILVHVKPSERIFPAASRLLRSTDKSRTIDGIYVAGLLGHEDLIPDLVPLLSSLDSEVRTRAKKAIDSIREVGRIQAEERLKAAGMIPK